MEIGFSLVPRTVKSTFGTHKPAIGNSDYKATRIALSVLRRAQVEVISQRAVEICGLGSGAINLIRDLVSINGPEMESLRFREKILVGEFVWRTRNK
jgi:hypothetical protein